MEDKKTENKTYLFPKWLVKPKWQVLTPIWKPLSDTFEAIGGGKLWVCVTHLHVGGPQGHAVSRQSKNDDYDVECGLKELVHLTVHITEGDVAHCHVSDYLQVCEVCSATLSFAFFPSVVSLCSSSSSLTVT